MALVSLCLLLLIVPLAAGGQNIGAGVIGAIFIGQLYCGFRQQELRARLGTLASEFRWPIGASLLYVAIMMFSTVVSPAPEVESPWRFLAGYVVWLLVPPISFLIFGRLSPAQWRKLFNCAAIVVAVLGSVSLSQAIWGWHIVGAHFVAGETRARAFYSHPLTLAYVCLPFVPLSVIAVLKYPRRLAAWLMLWGLAVAIFTSQSRTVQVVAAAVVFYNVWRQLRGRLRTVIATALCLAAVLVLVTPNPVGSRFRKTVHGNFDVQSGYADDRLAFWQVHWTMFLERPVLGHGINTDTAYRTKYYDALGLGAMQKKYEAHNMYLQIAVDGGLLALGSFLVWFGWCFRRAWLMRRSSLWGDVALQTLIAFAVAAFVQNSFQSSGVRFCLTLFCTALWLVPVVKDGASLTRRSAESP